jgi:hypothetical protein
MIFSNGIRGEFDFISRRGIDRKFLKRRLKFWKQKIVRGFSDDELWSLDIRVAEFMLPRLKRLIVVDPFVRPEAIEAFNEIVWMFEKTIECDILNYEDQERFDKATKLFGENFHRMWY